MLYVDYVEIVLQRLKDLNDLLDNTLQSARAQKEIEHLINQNELMLLALAHAEKTGRFRYRKTQQDIRNLKLSGNRLLQAVALA